MVGEKRGKAEKNVTSEPDVLVFINVQIYDVMSEPDMLTFTHVKNHDVMCSWMLMHDTLVCQFVLHLYDSTAVVGR